MDVHGIMASAGPPLTFLLPYVPQLQPHVHQHLIILLLSERLPARTRRIHPSADSNFFSGIQVGSVVIVLLNFNCGCSNKRLMLCVSLRPDGRWNLNGFPNIGRAYTQALMLDTMEFFS